MKAYFEYISENEKSFINFRFYMVILIFGLCMFEYALIFGKNGLEDYIKTSGVVQNVQIGTIKVKPKGRYDFRKYVVKEVVDVQIDDNHYIVRKDEEDWKSITLNQIRKNDSIVIYYHIIDGYKEITEIIKGGNMILNYKAYQKKWSFLHYLFPTLIIGFVTLFIWVIKMRRNVIKNKH